MKYKFSASLLLALPLLLIPGKLIIPATANSLTLPLSQKRLRGNYSPLKLAQKCETERDPKGGGYDPDPRGLIVDPNTPYIISPSDTYLLYEMAIKLATDAGDSEELEKAQEGLQKINAALKKRSGREP